MQPYQSELFSQEKAITAIQEGCPVGLIFPNNRRYGWWYDYFFEVDKIEIVPTKIALLFSEAGGLEIIKPSEYRVEWPNDATAFVVISKFESVLFWNSKERKPSDIEKTEFTEGSEFKIHVHYGRHPDYVYREPRIPWWERAFQEARRRYLLGKADFRRWLQRR